MRHPVFSAAQQLQQHGKLHKSPEGWKWLKFTWPVCSCSNNNKIVVVNLKTFFSSTKLGSQVHFYAFLAILSSFWSKENNFEVSKIGPSLFSFSSRSNLCIIAKFHIFFFLDHYDYCWMRGGNGNFFLLLAATAIDFLLFYHFDSWIILHYFHLYH